jgi:hypothetical protein
LKDKVEKDLIPGKLYLLTPNEDVTLSLRQKDEKR